MNQKLNIVLFAYNFPHRKTIDFFNKLYEIGFHISLILAANSISIKSPKSAISLPKKTPNISIDKLAVKYNVPFYVVEHNSTQTLSLLTQYRINFGIVSGARILKKDITKEKKTYMTS